MVAILEFFAACIGAVLAYAALVHMAGADDSYSQRRRGSGKFAWIVYFFIIGCSILSILLSEPRL